MLLYLRVRPVGESILQGEGAGPGPTSSSLLSDLLIHYEEVMLKNLLVFHLINKKLIKSYDVNNYSNSLIFKI